MKADVLIKWCCIGLLTLAFAGCKPSYQSGELFAQFLRANTAYKAGDYDAALRLYEDITEKGYVSAAVFYNVGNCMMKKNQLGAALVWYERALRLAPRDADLRANWLYARSMIKNPELSAPTQWTDRMFVHLDHFAEDEIIMVLCLLLSAISLLILAGLFWGWRFRKTIFLIVILSLIFIFHVFAFFAKIENLSGRAILLSSVEVKYEPEDSATTHFMGYEGWKVRILKESSGWVKIERPDGLAGWVAKDRLQRI